MREVTEADEKEQWGFTEVKKQREAISTVGSACAIPVAG